MPSLSSVGSGGWVQRCSIIACDAVGIDCWLCSAWVAMAEEVARGMGIVLVFSLMAAKEELRGREGGGRLTATVSPGQQ